MWHPVGNLPAHVYWRRRVVVLVALLAVLGVAGWLVSTLLADRQGGDATTTTAAVPEPALERVVPSLSAVATPDPPPSAETAEDPAAAAPEPGADGPAPGGPCTDDMLGLELRAPAAVDPRSKPTFEIAVSNVSAVPCVRALDKGLQEIVMLDPAGNRVWGSNDCFPEAGTDSRTLAPGEVVTIPLVWGGLTSEPTCTGARNPPPPGAYLLRARLDTKVSADVSITLS